MLCWCSPLTSLETLWVLTQPWRGSGYLETVTGPASRRLISSRPGTSARIRAQTRRQLEDKKLSQSLKSILIEILSQSTLSNDKFIQRQINNSNQPPPSRQFYPSSVRISIFSRPRESPEWGRGMRQRAARARVTVSVSRSRAGPGVNISTAGAGLTAFLNSYFYCFLFLKGPGIHEPNHRHDLLHHSPGNGCHFCHSNINLERFSKQRRV